MKEYIEHYQGYIDRNETFEEFAYDVNTLGFSIDKGWIETTKTHMYIKNKNFENVGKISLKDIWQI